MMSDTTITTIVTALLVALPPTIISIATLIQSLRNSKQVDVVAGKADDLKVKANQLAVKAQEIHDSTNGTLTKMETKLETAETEIKSLKVLIETLHSKQGAQGEKGDTGDTGDTGARGPAGHK